MHRRFYQVSSSQHLSGLSRQRSFESSCALDAFLEGRLMIWISNIFSPWCLVYWGGGGGGGYASATARVVKWWWRNQFSGGGNQSTERKPPTYGKMASDADTQRSLILTLDDNIETHVDRLNVMGEPLTVGSFTQGIVLMYSQTS